jgi:alpha-glucosidase
MKYKFRNVGTFLIAHVLFLFTSCSGDDKSLSLTSKDGSNTIELSLNETGALYYQVKRSNGLIIGTSPLGVKCDDQDFTQGLSVAEISPVSERRETYQLQVANKKQIDQVFATKSVTFKNSAGAAMIVDMVAGKEGVAFRYRFPEEHKQLRVVEEEITGFQVEKNARGWLQPYNTATHVTPAYEDFYLSVSPGDTISQPRNPSVGWCMPALFNVNDGKHWMLLMPAAI